MNKLLSLILILFTMTLFSQGINKIEQQKKKVEIEVDFLKKSKILNDIANYYYENKENDSATIYFQKILNINATKLINPELVAHANYRLGGIFYRKSLQVQSIENFEAAYSYYKKLEHNSRAVTCLINIAGSYAQLNKEVLAIQTYIKSETIADEKLKVDIYSGLSSVYNKTSQYEQALSYLSKALKICNKIGIEKAKGFIFQKMGDINVKLGNFEQALIFYRDSEVINTKFNQISSLVVLYNNMGDLSEKEGDYVLAKRYYHKAIDLSKEIKNLIYEATITSNLANIDLKEQKYFLAAQKLIHSIQQFRSINYNRGLIQALLIYGKVLEKSNQTEKSISTYLESYQLAKQEKSIDLIIKSGLGLSLLYKNQAKYEKAFLYREAVDEFQKELSLKNKSDAIETLRIKFDIEKIEQHRKDQEAKVAVLEEKRLLSIYIYILSGIGAVLIMLILYRQVRFYQTKKESLEYKQTISHLKEEKLKNKVEIKGNQIIDFALHIKEKNDLLEDLEKRIKSARRNIKEENARDKLQQILLTIKKYMMVNKNRVEILAEVNDSQNEFYTSLGVQYPKLNEREKNIAALIRLNFSSKQIAENLNLTAPTLNNIRSEMRKKMNISRNQNLIEFLKKL